ncbi:hypothetical protein BIT28_08755 [Photobacterium proteolyticum]|uniref:Uncharacterized protein n=1 Tax=Photobacterium proteolyticum TaxID=1903952 RepID=A0A1Q9GIG0_9GAMM|nr:hypothetical protein [Photobacterium proteolyticum]OLQ74259.1 hypothetical protein BIT28_08755 [Photobacterium proteolyticum]
MTPFSQINMVKSQQIYATFVNGKVITKQVYDLYQQSFLESQLYTELYNNLEHFTQLYLHIGYTLNFNVDGEFFYISRSEAEEDADTNATKIQAMLLIIARYWVDKGYDLDDLMTPVIGLGRTALEEIAEQTIYDDIRQALGIETWDKALNYLADRNFLYQCGDKHYILSSAGMHFLNLHVEKYSQEQD